MLDGIGVHRAKDTLDSTSMFHPWIGGEKRYEIAQKIKQITVLQIT